MKYLALDIGEKVVGVASSESGIIATPLLPLKMGEDFMSKLGEIVLAEKPDIIIFGIPTNDNGDESGLAKDIRRLAEGVRHEFNVDVDFEDEYGTTKEAEDILEKIGVPKRDFEKYDDSLAAALILESYLERHRKRTT